VILQMVVRSLIIVTARRTQERQCHQRGPEQDRESYTERCRDQHVDMDRRVAAGDEQNRNSRDDDRKQSEQPEESPKAPNH